MPEITLALQVGELPEGFCPQTEQQRLNGYAAVTTVLFPFDSSVVNYGSTTPSADQREFPWYRLNPDGTPDGWYSFINGYWLKPHVIPPSDLGLVPYLGTLASVTTYQGGEAAAVTDITGPFWQVASEMQGFVPIGVSTDFAQGTSGGAQNKTLALNNMPNHSHDVYAQSGSGTGTVNGAFGVANAAFTAGYGGPAYLGQNGSGTTLVQGTGGDASAVTQAFSIMNPYFSIYFLKRTARIFYRI